MIKRKTFIKIITSFAIVLIALLINNFVVALALEDSKEILAVVLIWGCCSIVLLYLGGLYKSVKDDYNNLRNAEIDVDLFGKKSESLIHIEKEGKHTMAIITEVSKIRLGGCMSPLNPDCYVIEYQYLHEGNSYSGLKGLYDTIYNFHPTFPVVGDKVKIIYNQSTPEKSVIYCTKANKVPFCRLQRKFDINFVNN